MYCIKTELSAVLLGNRNPNCLFLVGWGGVGGGFIFDSRFGYIYITDILLVVGCV